jgi:ABC-2 type transport system ATP-binding protein
VTAVPAIVVEDLHKSYGSHEVLRGVDLVVAEGECLALLGPNGAGKTTAVEILEGHRARSSGRVSVLGVDPAAAGASFRDRIGIVLQEAGVEGDLRVAEALRMYGGYYRRPRPPAELLALVGLEGEARAPVKWLSGGQRRRLDLALGLVGRPSLVFLDEPTTGFDPAARRAAWSVIAGLAREGTTVLLTTHYLEEAHTLAHRVAVLSDGRIVAEGPPDRLVDDGSTEIRFRLPPGATVADLPAGLRSVTAASGFAVLHVDDPTSALAALTTWAAGRGLALDELTVRRPTLEDVYLALTGDADSTPAVRRGA